MSAVELVRELTAVTPQLLCLPVDVAAWATSAVAVIAAVGVAVREARKPLYPARRADDAGQDPDSGASALERDR